MTTEEIFERIRAIICDKIERADGKLTPDMVKMESHFIDDLGADSLDVLELIVAIEEEFDLEEIPESDAEKIQTVEDAVKYIQNLLA